MSERETEQFDMEPETGMTVEERLADRITISVPHRHNEKLREILARVNGDDDLYGLWTASNVNAIERLGMTDHGPVHVKIVLNMAVRLLRLLMDGDIVPGVVENYGMEKEDAEVVVALASLLHDVGMSIHRADHEAYSLFVAQRKLEPLLADLYPPGVATIMRSEILHAIISHRTGGRPLTIEAGVVRIADALDMAKGRSRIPFESGSASIHSMSAAAIEEVKIERGDDRPIRIRILMSNSAGVFQLDQLFREKLRGSGLERYVDLEAELVGEGETEKRLFTEFRI